MLESQLFEILSFGMFGYLIANFQPLKNIQSFFSKYKDNLITKLIYFLHTLTSCPICSAFWATLIIAMQYNTFEIAFIYANLSSLVAFLINKINEI